MRAFWTIVMEGRPTAFRSGQREELVPTLKQLQSRHPDTHLMWFQNGRYWHSPVDAIRPRAPRRESGRPQGPRGNDRRRTFDRPRGPGKPGPRGHRPGKGRRGGG